MWVLCDINAAYVSFCALFNPQYNMDRVPLGVLSSNQGNVIARNQAIKDLNVKMGDAAFNVSEIVKHNNGHLWGSNFNLFGDMSDRFHTELEMFVFDTIRYSVDESFGKVDVKHTQDLKKLGHTIQNALHRNVGLTVGLGMASTKTLAKLGSHCAKQQQWKPHTRGVVVLDTQHKIDWALKHCPVGDIWGVGSRTKAKLNAMGVATGLDLKNLDISIIKQQFSVVLARTVQELNGINAVELKDIQSNRDRICVSQSMGKAVTCENEMMEAVATHTTRAANKLRRFETFTSAITIFIGTNSFDKNQAQYHKSQLIRLPFPCADTLTLVAYATYALKSIFKAGFKYKKAGVILEQLSKSDSEQQLELLSDVGPLKVDKRTAVLDEINKKFGQSTIHTATEDFGHDWRPKDNLAPPSYTTKLSDLPTAKA